MSNQYPCTERYDATASTSVSGGGGASEVVPDDAQPAVSRRPGMRIKNLDTGEEYDLEDFNSDAPAHCGPRAHYDVDPTGALEDEDGQNRGPAGKQAKVWLKGTKKLKTWAKSTLSNVREKIEERIEKQQQQRELQKQYLAQSQQPHQVPQQQQQKHHHNQRYADSEASSSAGGWDRRSEAGLHDGREPALGTSVAAEPASAHSSRSPSPPTLPGSTPTGPSIAAVTSSAIGASTEPSASADSGHQVSAGGALPGSGHRKSAWDATSTPMEAASLGGSATGAATDVLARPAGQHSGPWKSPDGLAIGKEGLPVSTSAKSLTELAAARGLGTRVAEPLSISEAALAEPSPARGSAVTQTAAGVGAAPQPPRPLPAARGPAVASSASASAFSMPGPVRSTAGPGSVTFAPSAAGGSSGAGRALRSVGPLTAALAASSAAAASTAAATTVAPATASPVGMPVAPAVSASLPVVVPPIPLAAEGTGGHQQSEELRIPLLEDDLAGPSSRAVPTARSWLNQPARVTGGRRAAGRQLQQVRMIQEVFGHDGAVWAMRFSADARLLATAGRDGILRVWSVYWYPQSRSKLISATRDSLTSLPQPSASAGPLGLPASSGAALAPPYPSAGSFSAGHAGTGPSWTSSSSQAPASGAASRPPLLSESPLLSLYGHRSDVLDLSWSQCRLLLTASADQTARLWYIDAGGPLATGGAGSRASAGGGAEGSMKDGAPASGPGGGSAGLGAGLWGGLGGGAQGAGTFPTGECLRSFVHPDFVTSCCFHPSDPRVIVTGCADGKIRVWSVPDAAVIATATVQQDIVTRVLFSNDGSRVVAGTLRGKARYYEYTAAAGAGGGGGGTAAAATGASVGAATAGGSGPGGASARDSGASLDYLTQLDVKNAHGSGRKVTGLAQVPYTYGNDQLYVITSADSRIRLYVGYAQERKFKGHRNANTQIAASLSPNCQHLICGSDDGSVYIWETGLPPPPPPGANSGGAPGGGSAGAAGTAGPSGRVAAAAASAAAAAGALAAAARSRAHGAAVHAAGLVGAGKVKEGSYEAFQTPESTTTVALVAPNVCRVGRGLDRNSAASAGGAPSAGPAAAASSLSLMGALFVVAGFSGRIYVYENMPAQGV